MQDVHRKCNANLKITMQGGKKYVEKNKELCGEFNS